MARQLRIEYERAFYHVTSRERNTGNQGYTIDKTNKNAKQERQKLIEQL